jgi:glycosyltransferase involved in cell wall biosynthesis
MESDIRPRRYPLPAFLSLCLPAYNESISIQDKLDGATAILPAFVRDFEIVIVNDGSRDDTHDIVARYARRDHHVRLIDHESNRGYGAAVTTALRSAEGDLVMFTDSDNQFSLLDLPRLLAALKGHDLVVGYRSRRADHRIRLLNAWAWNQLIRFMLGVRVRDLDCAFKLFRREVLEGLQLTVGGAGINAEIMAQCFRAGFKIAEVPVNHYPRYHGAPTGASLKVIARAFRELPQLWKYRKPVLAAQAAGLAVPSWHVAGENVRTRHLPFTNRRSLLSVSQ